MSVFGMLIVDWMLDCWIASTLPTVQTYTFVDDWQFLMSRVDELAATWTSLQRFTAALDLEIDDGKSFVWAADQAQRKEVRAEEWPVQLNSKVLAITPLGGQHFQCLRTGAVKGLRTNRKGCNPMVHLSTYGLSFDPECWSILRSFQDAREYGGDTLLFDDLIRFAQERLVTNGPVAVLVERAERLGWVLQPSGHFADQFGSFDLLTAAWEEILVRVKWSWMDVVGTQVLHRDSMDG